MCSTVNIILHRTSTSLEVFCIGSLRLLASGISGLLARTVSKLISLIITSSNGGKFFYLKNQVLLDKKNNLFIFNLFN